MAPHGLLAAGADEGLDDLVVHVGLEQSGADLFHGLPYIGLADPAAAGQLAEDIVEAVAQRVEHDLACLAVRSLWDPDPS